MLDFKDPRSTPQNCQTKSVNSSPRGISKVIWPPPKKKCVGEQVRLLNACFFQNNSHWNLKSLLSKRKSSYKPPCFVGSMLEFVQCSKNGEIYQLHVCCCASSWCNLWPFSKQMSRTPLVTFPCMFWFMSRILIPRRMTSTEFIFL